MQMLMSHIRAAMQKYNMVQDGDVIAVGVSGGKDSVALLCALAELRRFYPAKYELQAITLDPNFLHERADYSRLEELCSRLNVPYTIKRTELYDVIFEQRQEKNPCSLCARMRRGLLHDTAKELGCNKLALGHHLDDAVVTFYMNLLQGGRIGCFSPVSYLSRKELYMIRPLIFTREREIINTVNRLELPVVKSKCPADGVTERQKVAELINSLERENGYNAIYQKTIGALQRAGIDGWTVEE